MEKKTTKKATKKNTQFSSETAKAANKKSRESARRNKSLREWATFYGKQRIKINIEDKEVNATWDGAVIVGLYQAAMQGDSKAAKLLAELSGQAPEQQVNVKAEVKEERNLSPKEAAAFIEELQKRI